MDFQPETTLIELILYNNWANARVLAACQELTADQLAATAPGTYGSIRDTLRHIIRAEADYVGRMRGEEPQPSFDWANKPELADVATYAGQVGEALLDTVQRTSPTFLVHEEDGQEFFDYHARLLFIQVIDHGIEHRTNITTIISGLGLTAPEVDGWGYLSSHPDRFAMKAGKL